MECSFQDPAVRSDFVNQIRFGQEPSASSAAAAAEDDGDDDDDDAVDWMGAMDACLP